MKANIPKGPSRGEMMKKLQTMQEDMNKKQQEIENSTFNASAGGGAVEVEVSGAHELKSVKIDPEVVDPEDVDMLQDLIMASINEAMRKATDAMEKEMGGLTDGINMPGLGGLF